MFGAISGTSPRAHQLRLFIGNPDENKLVMQAHPWATKLLIPIGDNSIHSRLQLVGHRLPSKQTDWSGGNKRDNVNYGFPNNHVKRNVRMLGESINDP